LRLVVDTSSLIYLVERRVDPAALAEHTVFTTYAVLEELQTLARRSRKARVAVKVARMIAPFVVDAAGPADRSVVEAAGRIGGVVLSGDAEVVGEARRRGLAVALFHDGELVAL
jgi:rRNA-processing protein FCF1